MKTENKQIPSEAILVTLDVNSLYMSIPHDEAYLVTADFLERREKKDPPTHFLSELLELVLEKNFFRCDQDYYIQRKGIAITLR